MATSSAAPSSTAADVSSHEVSIPRILMSDPARGAASRPRLSDDVHLDLRRTYAYPSPQRRRIDVDEMRQRIGVGNRRRHRSHGLDLENDVPRPADLDRLRFE